jgi:hypothetical protein
MKVCILCHKNVAGSRAVKVKEDRVIRVIRKIKQLLRVAAGNELYVCEEDISKQVERRRSFEKNMLFFGILATLVVLLFLASVVMSGTLNLWVIVSAFFMGAFILLFALVFKYVPAIENTTPVMVPGIPATPKSTITEEVKKPKKEVKKPQKKKKK